MRKVLCMAAATAVLALGACASTTDSLQMASARVIGNLSPSDVTVSNVDRGMMTVTWNATTPSGEYECFADDMVRQPGCTSKN